MMGKTDGDNYTLDDMFVSSAAQRESEGREEERMRNRAIGESRRLAASMDRCQRCFSSQELQKHLIVAIGSKVREFCECRGGGFVPKGVVSVSFVQTIQNPNTFIISQNDQLIIKIVASWLKL